MMYIKEYFFTIQRINDAKVVVLGNQLPGKGAVAIKHDPSCADSGMFS